MKIYVDFDGVILDSEKHLFYEWNKRIGNKTEEEKIKYVKSSDWNEILSKSEIINNSIEILKDLKDIIILTKVHSMENEGVSKIKILRELGIPNDVILSPYGLKKTDVVDAYGNMLVDDTVHNLDDWKLCGGIPIFFNKDNSDIDGWKKVNKEYPKIKSLDYLKNIR